jgi:type IX secretion system substrate protein
MFANRFRHIVILCFVFAASLNAGVQTRTHPYLFLSLSDTSSIKNRAKSAGTPANQFWNLILAVEADRYKTIDGGAELLANFNCHENIYSLALAYVLTGNSTYFDALKVLLWQGRNSQIWGNQKGLLDPTRDPNVDYNYWLGAKKIIGECLVYDLLYNDFTIPQRDSIKNAILSDVKNQHGGIQSLRSWVLDSYVNHYFSNPVGVEGAALGIAAMTLYDDPAYPEAASDLQSAKERVITAQDSYLKRYFPEGANYEGVTYSFLGLDRVLIMMYILSRFDGVDYFNQADIASVISKTPEWWAYEVLPGPRDKLDRCFNDISDMYYRGLDWESGQLTGLLIVGAKYNKPLCKWIFDNTITSIPDLINQQNTNFLSRAETPLLFTALLTYDGLPSVEPATLLPKSKIWYERGLVYCRTSDTWASSDDIQFAMEGHQIVNPVTHGYSKGHTQGDKNHFTLSAFSQDFITDQGYAVEKHNYIYIDGRPQAHNPYTDAHPYDGAPSSTDLRLSSSSTIDYIHGDATDAFNHLYAQASYCQNPVSGAYCVFDQTDPNFGANINPVDHAHRYVNFIRASNGLPTYIVIADDIKKPGTETHEYRWRAHTLINNGVTLGNPTVITGAQNPNNKLYLYYYDPTPYQITPVLSTIQYTEGPDQAQGYGETTLNAQQFDLQILQAVNPYFHVMMLPYKPGLAQPTTVTSIAATNGSILKSAWSAYVDYSVFKKDGNVSWDLLSTDAKLSLIRENNSQSVVLYSLSDGGSLTFRNTELVNLYGSTAFVSWNGNALEMQGSIGYFRCYGPNAASVKINGANVGFVQVGNYVESNTVSISRQWSGIIVTQYPVTVSAAATLRIDPASSFKFSPDAWLTVNGKLIAKGTSGQRITFTSINSSPAPGDWTGIICSGGGPDTLTYCDIKYAGPGINFTNTVGTSYMQNDTVSQCAIAGQPVRVQNTSTATTALRMYKCGIKNNQSYGMYVTSAKVSISYSSIDTNCTMNFQASELYATNGARVFLDSSRIQYGGYYGVNVGGQNSIVLLCPDSTIKPGINTIYGHDVSEVNVTNSGSFFSGSSSPPPPGIGGSNNIYNTLTSTCRLINNQTNNNLFARWTYWGSSGNRFCSSGSGSVDTLYPLGSPVPTPAKTAVASGDHEGMSVTPLSPQDKAMLDWLSQLKAYVDGDSDVAVTSLQLLALYVGPGGKYVGALGTDWESFLSKLQTISPSASIRQNALALQVQAKLDQGQFDLARSASDVVLGSPVSDDMWWFCQRTKQIACVALGDFAGAEAAFNSSYIRGMQIDSGAVIAMREYILNSEGKTRGESNSLSEGSFVKREGKALAPKPTEFYLEQNYPNPFNPLTVLSYNLPQPSHAILTVFNTLGQEVKRLADGLQDKGYKSVSFDASGLPSGVYFYRLQAGNFTDVKKMIFIR